MTQLEYYMERSKKWLADHGYANVQIHGQLIGSMAPDDSTARGAIVLKRRISESGPNTPWKVRDYVNVLEDTDAAHRELLEIRGQLNETTADTESTG